MKILFNCLTMEKGGAERVIMLLANKFAKKNEVSILTLVNSKDAYTLDTTIKRLHVDNTNYKNDNRVRRIARKLSFKRLNVLKKHILLEKPDVVISFLPEPSLRLMLLSKLSPKIKTLPKIISIRNDPEKEFSNPLMKCVMKRLYKNVDGMVYQTEDARKYFRNIVKTNKQMIISNPIDASMLIKPKEDAQRKNIVVSVGRLEKQKNQELLIRAFADTIKKQKHDYMLEIYGEGSLRNHLQDLIDELEIGSRVSLKGQIDNVSQILNDSKIFVFSSYYEGMPNALLEAMAMGLPCISTDCPCGGPRSLIKNEKNGILVKNNDEKRLSEAIINLVSDAGVRKKLSKNALQIRKTNSAEVILEQWQQLIDEVVEKNVKQ